ncbi:hypothetical protein [Comamonas sp. NLF-1-9]|uniref:hemerythrin domain-containing protein n=1 Tax=Comamonas sp. NLF-1-9 TaxID=2853163 RepID=UPI001C478969|nr:hypothetical protein [Comamonas sp. NLF-1-9]QXL83297.1 hypothetical protein KUD94_08440 [Comamonas sp. NLF-1-9]
MISNPDPARHFAHQHAQLDALLQTHLLELMGGDFARAEQAFSRWRAELVAHIAIEERELLPHLPAQARWAAKVYLAEHERIALLAREHAARLTQVLANPPEPGMAQRRAALWLIDAVHPLRHVLEHHHQREEGTLALELAQDLQARAWSAHG